MKSPTDELLDLSLDMDTEPPRSGFTGGLDLYSELIDFSSPMAEQATGNTYEHAEPAVQPAATEQAWMRDPSSAKPATDGGPLPHAGDVIRITGPLAGFGGMAAAAAMMVCGDCGNQTPISEMFCIHCGGLIEAETANAEAAVTLANLCGDCGGTVESDEIFCPGCGTVMATA